MKKEKDRYIVVSSGHGHSTVIADGESWKLRRTLEKESGDIKKTILIYELNFINKGGVLTLEYERISDVVREALL